jgi:hypothetical protein
MPDIRIRVFVSFDPERIADIRIRVFVSFDPGGIADISNDVHCRRARIPKGCQKLATFMDQHPYDPGGVEEIKMKLSQ